MVFVNLLKNLPMNRKKLLTEEKKEKSKIYYCSSLGFRRFIFYTVERVISEIILYKLLCMENRNPYNALDMVIHACATCMDTIFQVITAVTQLLLTSRAPSSQ